jgi:putative endonuclease
MSHFVYMLRCADGSLYTGYTTDLAQRTRAHNGEIVGGARYTRGRRPVRLVYHCTYRDRSQALQAEADLKKLPRQKKLQLI